MFVRCLHSDPLQWARCTEIFYLRFSSKSQRNYKITSWSGAICLEQRYVGGAWSSKLPGHWVNDSFAEGIKNVAVEFPLQTAEGNEKYFRYDSTVIVEIFHSLQRNWKIFSATWKDSQTIFHPPALSPRKFSFPIFFRSLSCVRLWRMAKFSIPDSFYK